MYSYTLTRMHGNGRHIISSFLFSSENSHFFLLLLLCFGHVRLDIIICSSVFRLLTRFSSTLCFFCSSGALELYSGYEAIICGNKLGKQYAIAVTEQEDLCRQNRKSFFSSSVFLVFSSSAHFSVMLLCCCCHFALSPPLPLDLSSCVCVWMCINL